MLIQLVDGQSKPLPSAFKGYFILQGRFPEQTHVTQSKSLPINSFTRSQSLLKTPLLCMLRVMV